MANDYIFSDFDLNFGINPHTKDISKKLDANAINQALKVILLTMHYEKPFDSAFGSSVKSLMFEQQSDFTTILLKKTITQTINNFEPRVKVLNIDATIDPDNYNLNISIEYEMLLNSVVQVFEIILERTR